MCAENLRLKRAHFHGIIMFLYCGLSVGICFLGTVTIGRHTKPKYLPLSFLASPSDHLEHGLIVECYDEKNRIFESNFFLRCLQRSEEGNIAEKQQERRCANEYRKLRIRLAPDTYRKVAFYFLRTHLNGFHQT